MTGRAGGPPVGELGEVHLDVILDRLGRSQLLRVARRFSADEAPAKTVADARQRTVQTLNRPARLAGLIATLSELELQLLGEVKRQGGVADGWALIAFARARSLRARTSAAAPPELFQHYSPAAFDGAELIWPLLADGLLIPATIPNPWLQLPYGASYYPGDEASPLLLADARLLAALPPVSPRSITLKVPPASTAPAPPPPQRLSLQLLELLRGVREQGGLPLTQGGLVNRLALKRLDKQLPALDGAELWVDLASQLGLLEEDEGQGQLRVVPQALEQLLRTESAGLQARLGAAYPYLPREMDDHAEDLQRPLALRAVLRQLLSDLPHPAPESEVLDALARLAPPPALESSWRQKNKEAWLKWGRAALRGPLSTFGLVALGGGEDPVVAVSPALQGKATPPGTGPAWVLQPNFELLVYPQNLQTAQLPLLLAAQAARFDAQSATYRLTRESVYAGLESGLGLQELLSGLEGASATPLASGVRSALGDWAARRERLVLHLGATLLEYPTRDERDAALNKLGGTAVGETLMLLPPGKRLPSGISVVRYDQPPAPALRFLPDGRFKMTGPLDLVTRQLLSRVAEARGDTFSLKPALPGTLPKQLARDLELRAENKLPAALRLQLSVWSGTAPPPALAQVSVLQHPQAQVLATHPRLKNFIQLALSPGLLLVNAGEHEALARELNALGLTPTPQLSSPGSQASELVMMTDTRKKREFIEQAIAGGHHLLVLYQEERVSGWYGDTKPGKRRQQELKPLSVSRQGSTPYLNAQDLETKEEHRIRIAYILGMAPH